MSDNWRLLLSGLLLGENDFSFQATIKNDSGFLLRRGKHDSNEITDSRWGSIDDAHATSLLSDFVTQTGGFNTNKYGRVTLVFHLALAQDDADKSVYEKKARLLKIADAAGTKLGVSLQKSCTLRSGATSKVICAFTHARS